MASSTRSALRSNSLPATSCIAMRPSGPCCPIDAHAFQRRRPGRPRRARAWSAPPSRARSLPRARTRCAASAASPARSAPCSRCSGGCGMISSWVIEAAPWRSEVPMQSEPVSPPPITTTCLPLRADRAARARRAPRRRRRRACSAGSGNPSRSGCRRARGPAPRGRAATRRRRSAPRRRSRPAATRPMTSTPTSTPVRNSTPSASICSTRRSIRCFSILKSGMP